MTFCRLVILLVFLLALSAGCTTPTITPGITVTDLDNGNIPVVNTGNFDIYTNSFQIENPTNRSYENVRVAITLVPSAVYCHGLTKTFSYPLFVPRMKKTEQLAIAEFANLGCGYDYNYKVTGDVVT